jgi:hypothetical protein
MLLRKNTLITVFVICWTMLFQYETLRASYLSPLAGRELPKLRFLFPPAGWIMFFNIDKSYGFAEVYGVRAGQQILLDPYDILETKAIGYDNIHRNVLVGVLSRGDAQSFCQFLHRKFPSYEEFLVVYALYPDFVSTPDHILRYLAYRCP